MSTSTITKQGWEVIPITKQMNMNTNGQTIIVQTDPTSSSGKSTGDIQQNIVQSQENSKYDNVQDMNVKPLNGGNKKKMGFTLYHKGREIEYEGGKGMKAKDIVENFIDSRKLKRECLVRVLQHSNNKNSLFKVRNVEKRNERIIDLY